MVAPTSTTAGCFPPILKSTPILEAPLEGPIYLRSNPERELPDIAAALHGQEINVVAVAHTDSAEGGGLRNTFAARRREAEVRKQSKSDSFCASEPKPSICDDPSEISGDYGRPRGGASKQSISDFSVQLAKPKHLFRREAEAFIGIPDAPISSVDIDLFGGNRGLIESSRNLCSYKPKAKMEFKGHNGKQQNYKLAMKASGCGKRKKHKRHRRPAHHRRAVR